MKTVNLGGEILELPDSAFIAQPPESRAADFNSLTRKALEHPLDKKPLGQWEFKDRRVALIIDDWGRPTPCSEFLPSVLEKIKDAADITIITASGMHDPMNDADMIRKVGEEVMRRYRCISHDAGNHSMLAFKGISPMGTPVWVNKYAAEADIRLSFGRIFPHICYGYEGGYKMIVPGIASFETILRDHSLNFSSNSDYGILKGNPSRSEADAIGQMVGIDFNISFVVDYTSRPVGAFGGSPEVVFPAGVNYGQRKVWGAITGKKADITLVAGSPQGEERLLNNPVSSLGLALGVTKPDGTVIVAADYKKQNKRLIDGHDLDLIPISELCRLHEKRDWNKDPRQIQHIIKTIRGVFYERRVLEMHSQKLYLASSSYPHSVTERWNTKVYENTAEAFEAALKEYQNPYIVAIPNGEYTLPLMQYDYPET
jgi:nickel-dependent lactate racemase